MQKTWEYKTSIHHSEATRVARTSTLTKYQPRKSKLKQPIDTHVKNNKRGIGVDKGKKKIMKPFERGGMEQKNGNAHPPSKKKKRIMKKMQELKKKLHGKFERAFFRAFCPDNVGSTSFKIR